MTSKSAQLVVAITATGFGCLLILAAFIVPPLGVIDPSVLAAFGEILTFAGAVIGVDYHYRGGPPQSPKGEVKDPLNPPRGK